MADTQANQPQGEQTTYVEQPVNQTQTTKPSETHQHEQKNTESKLKKTHKIGQGESPRQSKEKPATHNPEGTSVIEKQIHIVPLGSVFHKKDEGQNTRTTPDATRVVSIENDEVLKRVAHGTINDKTQPRQPRTQKRREIHIPTTIDYTKTRRGNTKKQPGRRTHRELKPSLDAENSIKPVDNKNTIANAQKQRVEEPIPNEKQRQPEKRSGILTSMIDKQEKYEHNINQQERHIRFADTTKPEIQQSAYRTNKSSRNFNYMYEHGIYVDDPVEINAILNNAGIQTDSLSTIIENSKHLETATKEEQTAVFTEYKNLINILTNPA